MEYWVRNRKKDFSLSTETITPTLQYSIIPYFIKGGGIYENDTQYYQG
jgi:hypothetical protein